MGLLNTLALATLIALISFLSAPISHIIRVGGVFHTPIPTILPDGHGPIYIEDTIHCEDVHHYKPANVLFTAYEKSDGEAVYIFAVNHLPNPVYFHANTSIPAGTHKAASQIELFHHVLGTRTLQHIRAIHHPLIETPNDIYAESASSFYVTNDHFYREGAMRHVEDVWPSAKWSSIIHVRLPVEIHEGREVEASVASTGLWNNNGLGHGRTADEMIISSAVGGELFMSTLKRDSDWNLNATASSHSTPGSVSISESVSFGTVTDNPSYYVDPYATADDDVSGVVVAGVSRAIKLPVTSKDPEGVDPVQVWYARPTGNEWEKRLLFEDDGLRIRTASAAVLVPVEPNGDGVKRAWLFVTGFMSEGMLAVQVEL
ncbi:hypothetical protein PENANT_c031G08337 [Penicillium antarcticum]|uniref:Serum paraoxonase/arylesterase family protein n=1 Tax=Penicillium antarcticum TaxID=416450 RepID=A0A1V6PV50_9EURO|nr:hypothetical protein PENANT_c031G08337 [Penicillium antarcticum]